MFGIKQYIGNKDIISIQSTNDKRYNEIMEQLSQKQEGHYLTDKILLSATLANVYSIKMTLLKVRVG